MGFLERLGAAVHKNINFKGNDAKNLYFGEGFQADALKKRNISQDVFELQAKTIAPGVGQTFSSNLENVSTTVFEDELALNSPARFITRYVNVPVIKNAIDKNPNIGKILEEKGLSTDFNISNVSSIMMSHLIPTAKCAQQVYLKAGHSRDEINYTRLTQAALLHDIGKVFIPAEILNKKGKLTRKEREIVELHNKLSYEILKTTNLSPQVARLALEHHDYEKNLARTDENQALTVADVYCALRESRPYKKPISDLGTKAILYDMGTSGKLDSRYVSLLN